MSNCKIYLGDSVYADFSGDTIMICLNNGYGDFNHIYLEEEIFIALVNHKERIDRERRENNSNNNKPS